MFRTLGGGDLTTNRTNETHPHSITELCREGGRLYANALRTGYITRADAEPAPCLMELALLHPDPDDANRLRPVPPAVALAQRLNPIEREISQRRRTSIELAETFEPFMALSAQGTSSTHSITVLEGLDRINTALDLATNQCTNEVLSIQPSARHPERRVIEGLERDKTLTERGVRIRTLYQHTARYSPERLAYVDRFSTGKAEYRTIDELVERLIICDETVAFIPVRDDRQVALEIRHPGLVGYLIKVFEFIWSRAVPLTAGAPYETAPDGITDIQHSIAKLLVEGHVDEAIARRLGMNVRTCRAHIAKLATALGSGSRAQLGYLIAQSGILEQGNRNLGGENHA
ncbi:MULTISPECIES: helix-turn-helix transcriptional regulator [Streptomyces]|uniref:Helix-turn-helix transcriptional regulator n=1 Tax=Streptomyces anthocyanicus TaxID=68174 RepID=A0ABZ1M0V0_9ACTN|nr:MULTISPECIES: helix-turn-helix transcriptional regulator [Streptomyces]MDX2924565.1 helix-turn-helix transcriptional regulator [Streptomyces sp. NRRL_B-16638]MDX3322404.1 helix-turn-helix transcriptional regulator [Streptomyces sp. ME03-5684b]MDX3350627.1 helix-turn-helix transcriptional regulator [Streptomyces sp. ME02-6979A]MDX3369295.1 helix-turn-helix transcriptional regulator [Streptomyces sp. ME02-6987-2C]MDX3425732.1 helix-turn-helix transcriptional regulator [Streptomyces sp. ME02-6